MMLMPKLAFFTSFLKSERNTEIDVGNNDSIFFRFYRFVFVNIKSHDYLPTDLGLCKLIYRLKILLYFLFFFFGRR